MTIRPAIGFDPITGITFPTNAPPDQGSSDWVIPILATGFTAPSRKSKVGIVTNLPLIETISNTVWSGSAVQYGSQELRRIQIDGTIDTPTVNSGGWQVPNIVIDATGQRINYAEFLEAAMEGTLGEVAGWWIKAEPKWLRDSYGRVYNNPRMVDINASYVEGIPGRTNVTLTLVVP